MPPRGPLGTRGAVRVHVVGPTWEVILEVPGIYGDAAGIAARMRAGGLLAQRKKDAVIVNANHVPERLCK